MPTLTGSFSPYPYPGGWSRAEIRAELAAQFGHHQAAATGGSTTTIVDTKLVRFGDSFFNGADAWISQAAGAAPQGETAYCTAFVSSTGTLTCSPAFSAAVQSTDRYELFQKFSKSEYDVAIARACVGDAQIEALTPSTTTLDYSLNDIDGLSDGRQIGAVWLRRSGLTTEQPVRLRDWQTENAGGVLTLRLADTLLAADSLWLEFAGDGSGMSWDDTRSTLPLPLIKARAMKLLLQTKLASQDSAGLEFFGTLLRHWSEQLQSEERRNQPTAGKVKKHRTLSMGGGSSDEDMFGALGIVRSY